MQVNGKVRLVAQSSVQSTPSGLEIDGKQLTSPYVLDAIGDPHTLQGALSLFDGPISQFKDEGATVDVTELRNVDARVVLPQIPTPWLAHVASAEGILAVETIAGKNPRPINYDHVPGCTYCQPEVASVGLTEAKARERGYDVKVGHFPIPVIAKAQILGSSEGMVKVVIDARYDELLGVHLIGPHATELIVEGCVALQMEATVEELINTMHAHPTVSESMHEAFEDAHGMVIHV
jgi:hypothetical protein